MVSPKRIARSGLIGIVFSLLAGCGKTEEAAPPKANAEGFRAAVAAALQAQDGKALLGLAELRGSPAMQHFLLLDLLVECAEAKTGWEVSLKPLSAEEAKAHQDRIKAQDAELAAAPEGLLSIAAKSEQGGMKTTIPYGLVEGRYKILGARVTPAKRTELAATEPLKAAEAAVAEGFPVPGSAELDKAWKEKAAPLPAGGGEPGEAFAAVTRKLAEAVAAGDPDAVMALTGAWGEAVLAAKDFEGNPVPPELRKLKVASQSMRFLKTAKVLGGWIGEDRAALVVEGDNHAGNTERGAVFLHKTDAGWEKIRQELVEIPAP